MKYLLNAPCLFTTLKKLNVIYEEITREEFCREIEGAVSAVGHAGTAEMITTICGKKVEAVRRELDLRPGDVVLGIKLAFRPPEGRVYNTDEMLELYKQGRIKFFKITVIGR